MGRGPTWREDAWATLTPEKIKASVASEWKLQENEHNLLNLRAVTPTISLAVSLLKRFYNFTSCVATALVT